MGGGLVKRDQMFRWGGVVSGAVLMVFGIVVIVLAISGHQHRHHRAQAAEDHRHAGHDALAIKAESEKVGGLTHRTGLRGQAAAHGVKATKRGRDGVPARACGATRARRRSRLTAVRFARALPSRRRTRAPAPPLLRHRADRTAAWRQSQVATARLITSAPTPDHRDLLRQLVDLIRAEDERRDEGHDIRPSASGTRAQPPRAPSRLAYAAADGRRRCTAPSSRIEDARDPVQKACVHGLVRPGERFPGLALTIAVEEVPQPQLVRRERAAARRAAEHDEVSRGHGDRSRTTSPRQNVPGQRQLDLLGRRRRLALGRRQRQRDEQIAADAAVPAQAGAARARPEHSRAQGPRRSSGQRVTANSTDEQNSQWRRGR